MARALLDTDIFSEILKGRNQNVVAKATRYRSAYGHYSISVITVLEIVKGFHKLQCWSRHQAWTVICDLGSAPRLWWRSISSASRTPG